MKKDKYSEDWLIRYHLDNWSRIYPKGLRTDSSNYEPFVQWDIGAQVVALNFQTKDKPLMINYSKFVENGGDLGGYLLKPDFLRD
jgi:phosphatidylinositol phospholipase C delta